jgi:hypothetical protein
LPDDLLFDEKGGAMTIKQKKRKKKPPSAQPVDRAIPVIKQPKNTDAAKVSITRTRVSKMRDDSLWPKLKDVADDWSAAADAIEKNAERIAALRAELAVLEARQRELRHDWQVRTQVVLNSVQVACAKSKDRVQALGFDVRTQAPIAPRPVPTGLATTPGKKRGEAIVTWTRSDAHHDFVVQTANDPDDPKTYADIRVIGKKTFTVTGQASRSIVFVRVAAKDPNSKAGQSPWSAWVACTVA